MHPAAAQRLPERLGDVLLSLDLSERGRPVAAVERERSVGNIGTGPNSIARPAGRTGDVACHDLIRAEEGKGPLAHPPEPAYPCCLPALGELAG